MTSVLQDWVATLPLRAQGTLLTAVRGCDLTPKLPLDRIERKLVPAIRAAFMVPADPRELDVDGGFMIRNPPEKIRWSEFGHYPWHWLQHLVHTIEVLGYTHPDPVARYRWYKLYMSAVKDFHFNAETKVEWYERMEEDRVASGKVVQ